MKNVIKIKKDGSKMYVHTDLPIRASQFMAFSDQKLKENIISINDAVGVINKIKCFEYNFKYNKEKIHYGVLAQQLEDIEKLKPLVENIEDLKTVNYIEIIPWLIKAVQELTEEIANLREQNHVKN